VSPEVALSYGAFGSHLALSGKAPESLPGNVAAALALRNMLIFLLG